MLGWDPSLFRICVDMIFLVCELNLFYLYFASMVEGFFLLLERMGLLYLAFFFLCEASNDQHRFYSNDIEGFIL